MKAQSDGRGKPQQGHFFGGVCVTESLEFARFETLKLAISPQVGPQRSIFGGVVTLRRITGDLHQEIVRDPGNDTEAPPSMIISASAPAFIRSIQPENSGRVGELGARS